MNQIILYKKRFLSPRVLIGLNLDLLIKLHQEVILNLAIPNSLIGQISPENSDSEHVTPITSPRPNSISSFTLIIYVDQTEPLLNQH